MPVPDFSLIHSCMNLDIFSNMRKEVKEVDIQARTRNNASTGYARGLATIQLRVNSV